MGERNERTSIYAINQLVPIGRSFLNETERVELLNAIQEKEKNDFNFLGKQFGDNLISQKRTDWYIHEDESIKPYFQPLQSNIEKLVSKVAVYPSLQYGFCNLEYKIVMLESWFAKNQKNGYTRPHNHGSHACVYSFGCYLHLPSKITTLSFANHEFSNIVQIEVREGDILLFPSNMTNWAFGLEEERSIVSGNLLISMRERQCDCCGDNCDITEK